MKTSGLSKEDLCLPPIFFIWTHGEEKLKSFINHLNSSHETIKFTSEQSRDSISFLDVQVSMRGEGGGVLSTDLFCKSTDTHQYLHKKSCHPWHTKKAIPYGQALRFRRICSEDRQCQERAGELAGWLKDRGYEESLVKVTVNVCGTKFGFHSLKAELLTECR